MTVHVSIIIPAYNAANTIQRPLQSLLNQTFQKWEAIIIDDGSDDHTLEIVKNFINRDQRIRCISQANQGPGKARNQGIALAKYDWLLFLDADDWISPQHLEHLTNRLETDPNLDVVYCGWAYVLPDGEYIFSQIPERFGDLFVPLTQYCISIIQTFLVRKSLVEMLSCFDNSIQLCEDWLLWQRIARMGARFGIVKEVLAAYHTRPDSLTRNGEQLFRDGCEVINIGHGIDPKVPHPHPVYPYGLIADQTPKNQFYLLCACAGYLIGAKKDARCLLNLVDSQECLDLNPYDVAHCLFVHIMVSASKSRSEWHNVWEDCQQNLRIFLIALENKAHTPKLSFHSYSITKHFICRYAKVNNMHQCIANLWARFVLSKRAILQYFYIIRIFMKRNLWIMALLFPPARSVIRWVRGLLVTEKQVEDNHPSYNRDDYFEDLFSENPDPWGYTNLYEQVKYEQTLNIIPETAKGDALELACAEGHFTVLIAPQVKSLLATDISQTAIDRCQERCISFNNVRFQHLDFMRDEIDGCFDLIVCSEVLYFAGDRSNLKLIVEKIAKALKLGGYLVMTHSNVLIDDPNKPGFDWGHAFGAKFIGETFSRCLGLDFVQEMYTPLYRIQLFQRNQKPLYFASPLLPKQSQSLPDPEYQYLPTEILNDVVLHFTEKLPILIYPRIFPSSPNLQDPSSGISVATFEAQLQFLSEMRYKSISIDQWGYSVMNGKPLKGRAIVIAFKDASQDLVDYAWPLLKQYNFSATLLLHANEVGKDKAYDSATGDEISLIKWSQIRKLQSEGITFASCSNSRRSLTSLSLFEAWQEIQSSRQILQQELAIPITTFIYPHGDSNFILQYLVGLAGYDFAVTGRSGLCSQEDSVLSLPCIRITELDSPEILATKL